MTTLELVFPPSMGSAKGRARLELIGESIGLENLGEARVAVAESYEELHERAAKGHADLVWAPPLIASRLLPQARDVFKVVRHGVAGYYAALIATQGSEVALDSLRGRTVAWVGKSSVAGYRLPRKLLRERGLDPADLFERELFVGSYPAVLEAVTEGNADVGAMCINLPTEAGLEETVYQYGGAGMRGKMRALAVSERVTADCVILLKAMPGAVAEAIGAELLGTGRSRIRAAFTMALEAEAFERMDDDGRRELEALQQL